MLFLRKTSYGSGMLLLCWAICTAQASFASDVRSSADFSTVAVQQQAATGVDELRRSFVGTISPEIKANLRSIKLRGDQLGREEGVFGQWGDSITYCKSYLASISNLQHIDCEPEDGHDYRPILLWMGAEETTDTSPLYRFKGESFGNYGGWKLSNGLNSLVDASDNAIANTNASWSLTMFGTNDIAGSWDSEEFEALLEQFMQINIDKGIVPVLSTIPPRKDYDSSVAEANTVIKTVAGRMSLPLVDLYGLYLALHPTDWEDVLLQSDGIHPSHTYTAGDFSAEALTNDGYNIRSILTLDMAEKIESIIFENGDVEGDDLPIIMVESSTHPYKTSTQGLSVAFRFVSDSGPDPTGYSWAIDSSHSTIPDTVVDGEEDQVTLSMPASGTWYFHVRANSAAGWGPTVHYTVIAREASSQQTLHLSDAIYLLLHKS